MARSLVGFVGIFLFSAAPFVACSGSSVDDAARGDGDSGASASDAAADSQTDAASPKDGAVGNEGGPDAAKILELPLTGCPETGFTAPFSIGGSSFALIVDTGSAELAVASSTCANCTSVTPRYTPGASATDENQTSTVTYASTEGYQGEIYSDAFAASSAITARTKLISITSQTNGFFTDDGCGLGTISHSFQGIAGMGTAAGQAANTTAPFPLLVADGLPNIFSMALCGLGGNLWLGGFDPSAASAAPIYTSMTIDGNSNYAIKVDAVNVAGTAVGSAISDLVVDSDTTEFYLPSATYTAAKTAIGGNASFTQHFGGASFFANGDCIAPLDAPAPTSDQLDAALPTFTLMLDNGSGSPIALTMKATSSYLQPITKSGITYYCPELNNGGSNAVLGSSFLREQVVIYDIAAARIGFAPYAACATR